MKRNIQEAFNGKNGPHGKQTMIDRFINMVNDARTIYNQTGLSVFKDPDDMDPETIQSIADDYNNTFEMSGGKSYASANQELLSSLAIDSETGEDDIFTDPEAREFAMSRIEGRRINGENKYAEALSSYLKIGMNKSAQERADKKLAKKSKRTQEIVKSRKEKEERFAEMNKSLDLDALNFYNNVKSDPNSYRKNYPEEVQDWMMSNDYDTEQLNQVLMPYFQKEPEYDAYMRIKNICTHLSRCVDSSLIDPNSVCDKRLYFDGTAIMIDRSHDDVLIFNAKHAIVNTFHKNLFNSLNRALRIPGVQIDSKFHLYKYDSFAYVGRDVHFEIEPAQQETAPVASQSKPQSTKIEYGTDLSENEKDILEDIINRFNADYDVDEEGVIFIIDSQYKNNFEKYLSSQDIEFEELEDDDENLNENMKKQRIHLTESQLRNIINESVQQVINEQMINENKLTDMWNAIKTHPQEAFTALAAAGLLATSVALGSYGSQDNDYKDGHGSAVYDNGEEVGHMPNYNELQKDMYNR